MKRYALMTGLSATIACSGSSSGADNQPAEVAVPEFEPPVAVNAEPPVSYPADLFREGVEGTVVLLLYVDETGSLVPDSTRLQDGSGYPGLDSAVLAGVAEMQFAPARRRGTPVATWFLQPVHFRPPERTKSGGGP